MRNLSAGQTTNGEVFLLKNSNIGVTKTAEESGTRNRRRTATNQGDLGLVRRWKLVERGERGVANLGDIPFFKLLDSESLKTANVDS